MPRAACAVQRRRPADQEHRYHPEVSTVDEFIAPREEQIHSGALTSFEEVELGHITEMFGNLGHRFSTYEKRGVLHSEAFEAIGVISTQTIRTPDGWRISAMAWDDERPGPPVPDRYRRKAGLLKQFGPDRRQVP